MKALVTGSSGLIGSEMVRHFAPRAEVVGIDNNMRADFFGKGGDTSWNLARLREECKGFLHLPLDIRDREGVRAAFMRHGPFDLIVHCAAQPSHDLSASRPLDDFDVNAGGTVNLLEATRRHSPEATFVLLSTSKVYGDAPNERDILELETRYDYVDSRGISEDCRIDASLHSPFGASKVAADVMTQEYGRYFGLKTTCLRGGCLTGPAHSPVELHGFLAYLVRCQVRGLPYKIFGYKGKQVRDNIHSRDMALAVEAIHRSPRAGAVYNIGGGRENSCSILEAAERVQELTGKPLLSEYVERARTGDHIVYISDLSHFQAHYPQWKLTKSLDQIFLDLIEAAR